MTILGVTKVSAISAVITSTYSAITGSQGLPGLKELTLTIEQQLRSLQETVLVSNERLAEKLDTLTRDVDFLSHTIAAQPKINDAYLALMLRFDEAASKLKKIRKQLRRGSKISSELIEIFNLTDLFTLATLERSNVHKCERTSESSLRLDVSFLRYSENVEILRADPFSYTSVEEGGVCKYEYTGPEYVLHNKSSDCIRPLLTGEVIDDIVLGDGCNIRQPMSSNDTYSQKSCVKMTNEDLTAPAVQIKYNGQLIHINCQGRYITIDQTKSECPNNIFTIDASKTFTIDDYTYTHEASFIERPLIDYSVPTKINLKLGTAHKTFRSLSAEEVMKIRNEQHSLKRKTLAEELSNNPKIGPFASAIHGYVDQIGEYLALMIFFFLFILYVKSRATRQAVPTAVALLMLSTSIMASDQHLIEVRLNRQQTTNEISRHQKFIIDN